MARTNRIKLYISRQCTYICWFRKEIIIVITWYKKNRQCNAVDDITAVDVKTNSLTFKQLSLTYIQHPGKNISTGANNAIKCEWENENSNKWYKLSSFFSHFSRILSLISLTSLSQFLWVPLFSHLRCTPRQFYRGILREHSTFHRLSVCVFFFCVKQKRHPIHISKCYIAEHETWLCSILCRLPGPKIPIQIHPNCNDI